MSNEGRRQDTQVLDPYIHLYKILSEGPLGKNILPPRITQRFVSSVLRSSNAKGNTERCYKKITCSLLPVWLWTMEWVNGEETGEAPRPPTGSWLLLECETQPLDH